MNENFQTEKHLIRFLKYNNLNRLNTSHKLKKLVKVKMNKNIRRKFQYSIEEYIR